MVCTVYINLYYVIVLCDLENEVPTMKNINRYVTRNHAVDWKNIGIELGLNINTLEIIEKDHPLQCKNSFIAMIDSWIQSKAGDTTWKALEVALTNINRQKKDLDPVDDIYGMV